MENLDTFTSALRDVCANDPLREKWLVAPSLRIGIQWIDRVARSGQPVLNAHPKSLRGIATDLALGTIAEGNLHSLGGMRTEIVLDALFARLRSEEQEGIAVLRPSTSLTQALHRTIREIRLSGLSAADVSASAGRKAVFDDSLKGGQVARLLTWYEEFLEEKRFVDYASALQLATELVRRDPRAAFGEALLLIPDTEVERMRGLERGLWTCIPEENKQILLVDTPEEGSAEEVQTDMELLAWLPRPADAPAPKGDETVKLFRANGEACEVREVLRRCAKEGISLDEVELIHTDTNTYVPLVYEQMCRMEFGEDDNQPVTFEEGLPANLFRPGRALCAWSSWIADGYPQKTLVRMLQDGLIEVQEALDAGFSLGWLGSLLRAVAIREGRERYIPCIESKIEALKTSLEDLDYEDEEESGRRSAGINKEIEGLTRLLPVIEGVIGCSSEVGDTQSTVLKKAVEFLSVHARCTSRLDAYARKRLLESIEALRECIEEGVAVEGLDPIDWLCSLSDTSQVGGQGPTPGCLYVTNLGQGGHSGRKHTYIVGLDDRRFPGAGLQDPLLLDKERRALSVELPTAGDTLERRVDSFNLLASRLRGWLTMSYSCRNLADDREASYPTGVVAAAYRLLSGEESFDQEKMDRFLGPPAAFAPLEEDGCIDTTEWWMWRVCEAESGGTALGLVMETFDHLERGAKARLARESIDFTEYDGFVPEAAKDPNVNPALPDGRPVSASRLQTLASCPMDYFFSHVLGIAPPEEFGVDPTVWLDIATIGSLLHKVFYRFLRGLGERAEKPDFDTHWTELKGILDEEVEHYTREVPPPLAGVLDADGRPLYTQAYANTVVDLEKKAANFLRAETMGLGRGTPVYLEAAVGTKGHGGGSPLYTAEPVEVAVGSGEDEKRIRLRGRVDRVDLLMKTARDVFYALWDYKPLSGKKYREKGPFNKGRFLQGAIYPRLVLPRLQEVAGPQASVLKFGYLLATDDNWITPVEWTAAGLVEGERILWLLCETLAKGCFVFSPELSDIDYSNCTEAFGDLDTISKQAKEKLANPSNEALMPFRELRGIG